MHKTLTHENNQQLRTYQNAAAFQHSSWRHPGSVRLWPPPAPSGRSSSCRCLRWTPSHKYASERRLGEEQKEGERKEGVKPEQVIFRFTLLRCTTVFLLYLSWCFLLCSGQSAELISLYPCCGTCSAWTRFWRRHWTAQMKPVPKEYERVREGKQTHLRNVFCFLTKRISYLNKQFTLTCMPPGLMTSKAPVMLVTNWMTLLKLSSPILQEPSMRKTRSALAPLQTVMQVQSLVSNQSWAIWIIVLAHRCKALLTIQCRGDCCWSGRGGRLSRHFCGFHHLRDKTDTIQSDVLEGILM